jgi:uncharacterized protein YxeA
MKKILIFTLVILLYSACQPRELPSKISISETNVTLKVSHQSTKLELDNFKAQMIEKGFKVDFTGSEFDETGKITKLKYSITTPKGGGGSATVEFSKLKYNYYGFSYDMPTGQFIVGEQEE